MNIEKGRISGFELTFLITAMIQGSTLTASYIVPITKNDSWIVVISGLMVVIPLTIIYVNISNKYPDENIIRIHDIVYGKYIGKILSAIYIFYFLLVLSFNIRILGDFYTTFLLTDTPLEFFLIIFTLVCSFATLKGIEILARISHVFGIIAFIIILSTIILTYKNMKFSNLLPFFDINIKEFIQGTHIISTIPLGEVVIFMTIFNTVKERKHKLKFTLCGLVLGAISILLVSIRNIVVLGNTQVILINSSFQSSRLVDIGDIFTRMDVLISIGLTFMIFIKCSLFFYAASVSFAQIFYLDNYRPFVLPLGGIALILAILDWESSAAGAKVAPDIAPIFITPFVLIIPPITLLIDILRNRKRER